MDIKKMSAQHVRQREIIDFLSGKSFFRQFLSNRPTGAERNNNISDNVFPMRIITIFFRLKELRTSILELLSMFPLNITSLLGRELLVMVYNQIFTINSARKQLRKQRRRMKVIFLLLSGIQP